MTRFSKKGAWEVLRPSTCLAEVRGGGILEVKLVVHRVNVGRGGT
jgi:hypothetical protein